MGLERPSSMCKKVVTFATRKANFDCWELEWTQCWDVTHELDDGHMRLASCSRTFHCTPTFWKVVSECRVLCSESILVSSVDGWKTFITNCEEIHNNFSKLNCRSHVAENCIVAVIRGLRQALTRIGCLQALESGPTVEEPCPAEMADYDRVYDSVTGASLPSKLCEEAMQLDIKYTKEMNVYTPCEHGAMKEQGLAAIGTVGSLRTRAIQNILSSGQDWLLRRRRERRIWI